MRRGRGSWVGDAIAGAIAGGAATWVMDQTTTGMYDQQPPEVTRHEEAARPNGRGAVANLVARLDDSIGLGLGAADAARLETAIHYALGAVPGAAYAVASRRLPLVGAGAGLLYGLALWAVNDELLNTRLGLAGPPEAYPVEAHWRGFVGHAVLGSMTEGLVSVLRG